MDDKYISQKHLNSVIDYYLSTSTGAEHYGYSIIKGEVGHAPIANVVEVKYGHWKPLGQRTYGGGRSYTHYCSECGQHGYGEENYCSDCGAYMRGERQ